MKKLSFLSAAVIIVASVGCNKDKLYEAPATPEQPPIQNPSRLDTGPIVLYGSSSVTTAKWHDVQTVFPDSIYHIVQIGLGGATMGVLQLKKDTVNRLHPRQIVLWCGDNDIMDPRSRGKSFYAGDVRWTWKRTFDSLRFYNPDALITAIEIKKSPAISIYKEKDGTTLTIDSANALIKAFVLSQPNTSYVPINDQLVGHPEYFAADNYHLSPLAYTDVINPTLEPFLLKRDEEPTPTPVTDTPPPADNQPPVAEAGNDQTIFLRKGINRVNLDGRKSTDPDGVILHYDWKKIKGPKADILLLKDWQGKTYGYAAHLIRGSYIFQLKVMDNKGAFATDTKNVYVK